MTNEQTTKPINLWAVYGICLLVATIFFFIFGFNSPIYTFNSDHDYNWFVTVGHGLVAGKLPYRDLFEHKGPLVYFVTGFCCLFQYPNLVMLFIEILCMSLFFFFAYRIASKYLNTFYSFITIIILSLAIFSSWCRLRSADAIEELFLPIYAYFLLCWLEYIMEKRTWNWGRALCLGLCFGITLWAKFTLVYFMFVPMVIWFILSLRNKQFKTLIINLLLMLAGVVIITAPIIIFFATQHALGDLLRVYLLVNTRNYRGSNPLVYLQTFGLFFVIGPVALFLILWGVIRFSIKHWHERTGWYVLTAFLINLLLLTLSSKLITYYFIGVFPYAILGAIDLCELISKKLQPVKYQRWIFVAVTTVCIILCIPLSPLTYEWGRKRDSYAPLVIADVIHDYEAKNNTTATLWCYKMSDFGFYNAAGIIPNNYFFCQNLFSEEEYPAMYQEYRRYISEQTSDFIIVQVKVWNEENDFMSQYYQPYSYNADGQPTTYRYRQLHYFFYRNHEFILLIKKN